MLLQLKPKECKIQVCAPSNCAVDEILARVKDRGLTGLTNDITHLKKLVVRVGAPEYEPSDHIKEFTLQAQCREINHIISSGSVFIKLRNQFDLVERLKSLV